MRSKLSNEIFHDEMLSLYQQKDLSYQQVRDTAIEAMGRLIRGMETGLCHSPVIETQMAGRNAGKLQGQESLRLPEKAGKSPSRRPSWMNWPGSQRWRSAMDNGTNFGMN